MSKRFERAVEGPTDRWPQSKPSKKRSGKGAGGQRVMDGSAKVPSQRMLRVGELIRHKLAEMLARGEIRDEVLTETLVTIPEVRMSADLKLATAYVMPLGGKNLALVLAALDRNRRFIRSEVAHAVNLKFAPEIRFREDQSFEEATRIERLLASERVQRDLAAAKKREEG